MKSTTLRTAAFCLLALVLSAGQPVASSFPYYDDPRSIPQYVGSTFVGNDLITININNIGPAHDILFAVTGFQDVPNSDLSWNQGMRGWYGTV